VTIFGTISPIDFRGVQSPSFGEVATGILPDQAPIRIREEQRIAFERSSPDVRN
jgi:hypothetical protein